MMENCLNLIEDISGLSDNELSDRLVEFGFSRTPVTNMTRKYLEKQLISKLQGKIKKNDVIEDSVNGLNECQNSMLESPKNGTSHSNNDADSRIRHTISKTAETATMFYAVFCPTDNSEIGSRVFYEQEEAMKYAKKNKRSRFKPFKNYDAAVNFATHGVNGSVNSPVANQNNLPASNIDGASRFKGPKSQDLVQLRKAIENGNLAQVKRMVWENPRYLVSSGDTPSILQEGARYNALHIAAKVLNPEMTNFILETVSDMKFIQLLYGIESEENCRQRAIFLLDLYLNTPDKGLNETPLHLAVKFGAIAVVQVLVSYPECDRSRVNKFLKAPNEIICERVPKPNETISKEIALLLRDSFFVPVLRSIDAVTQPQVGDLFSSKQPLVTNNDPMSPHMDVTAYAGPMEYEQAQNFRRRWKTPPRVKASMTLSFARLNDLDRGLEREGRDLAKQFSIKWKEYWPFLGTFTDFSTQEGLIKLEDYLKDKFDKMSEELAANAAKNSDTQTTPTQSRDDSDRNLNNSQALSPMSDLCVALDSCTLTDKSTPTNPPKQVQRPVRASNNSQQDSSTSLSPILYIEKTCQVLARRLADGIVSALQANEEYIHLSKTLRDVLHSEVSNMQKLIISFKANSYFSTVNFQLMHSRIAMLIPFYLNDSTQSYDLILICSSLQLLASKSNEDSSEEESEKGTGYRGFARAAAPLRLGEQVACLAQQVIHALSRPGGGALGVADTEDEVMSMWNRGSECSCTWSASPPMPRNMRRGASLKRGFARQAADSGRVWTRDEAKQVVQRIPSVELDEDQSETSESEEMRTAGDSISVGDDTDAFFTPPSSVTSEEADMEEFDTPDEGLPVFLDGKLPTKLDIDVLRALDVKLLTSEQYPNIWRWKHELMQFPEHERECWPSPILSRQTYSSPPSSPLSTSALSPMKSPLVHRKAQSMQAMWGSPEPPFATPPKRRLNL